MRFARRTSRPPPGRSAPRPGRRPSSCSTPSKREAGFLDAISKFPEIEILSDNIYAGASRATAQEASENLLNRFPDIDQEISRLGTFSDFIAGIRSLATSSW